MAHFTQLRSSLFSRNNSPLTSWFEGESDIVVISVASYNIHGNVENSFSFSLYPFEMKIILPIGKFIDHLLGGQSDPFIGSLRGRGYFPLIKISACSQNSETSYYWQKDIFNGEYDTTRITDELDFLKFNFFTWQPQIANVYPGIYQQLTYYCTTRDAVRAIVYFKKSAPIEISLHAFTMHMPVISRVGCSLDIIKANSALSDVCDEITAYDIFFLQTNNTKSHKQRFVVSRNSSTYSHFFFQNSLGGFDTITATGKTKSIATKEIILFSNVDSESELVSPLYQDQEVNTGAIETLQLRDLWYEFIKSTNKYVLYPDGTHHRITLQKYKAEYTQHSIDSFSFTYRRAQIEKGNYYPKTELETII